MIKNIKRGDFMDAKLFDLILSEIREKIENERRIRGTTLKNHIEVHTKSKGVIKGNYITYYKEKIGHTMNNNENRDIICLGGATRLTYVEGDGKNNYSVMSYVSVEDIDFITAYILNNNRYEGKEND